MADGGHYYNGKTQRSLYLTSFLLFSPFIFRPWGIYGEKRGQKR